MLTRICLPRSSLRTKHRRYHSDDYDYEQQESSFYFTGQLLASEASGRGTLQSGTKMLCKVWREGDDRTDGKMIYQDGRVGGHEPRVHPVEPVGSRIRERPIRTFHQEIVSTRQSSD